MWEVASDCFEFHAHPIATVVLMKYIVVIMHVVMSHLGLECLSQGLEWFLVIASFTGTYRIWLCTATSHVRNFANWK